MLVGLAPTVISSVPLVCTGCADSKQRNPISTTKGYNGEEHPAIKATSAGGSPPADVLFNVIKRLLCEFLYAILDVYLTCERLVHATTLEVIDYAVLCKVVLNNRIDGCC